MKNGGLRCGGLLVDAAGDGKMHEALGLVPGAGPGYHYLPTLDISMFKIPDGALVSM
jgi:hypothetical protein